MVKNVWVQPQTAVQQFVANEYVAACGDINKVYKFVCDAGGGTPGTVYQDSNHNGKWDLIGDKALTGYILPTYHACGEAHEAPVADEFLDGFYLPNSNPFNPISVKIWTNNNTNIHCTTKINMSEWETAKS